MRAVLLLVPLSLLLVSAQEPPQQHRREARWVTPLYYSAEDALSFSQTTGAATGFYPMGGWSVSAGGQFDGRNFSAD